MRSAQLLKSIFDRLCKNSMLPKRCADAKQLAGTRLHRLVVRTSRCGRDNPGSTPGVVIFQRANIAGREAGW